MQGTLANIERYRTSIGIDITNKPIETADKAPARRGRGRPRKLPVEESSSGDESVQRSTDQCGKQSGEGSGQESAEASVETSGEEVLHFWLREVLGWTEKQLDNALIAGAKAFARNQFKQLFGGRCAVTATEDELYGLMEELLYIYPGTYVQHTGILAHAVHLLIRKMPTKVSRRTVCSGIGVCVCEQSNRYAVGHA